MSELEVVTLPNGRFAENCYLVADRSTREAAIIDPTFGLPQPAPGQIPAFDTLKVAAFRTASAAVAPLRRSEGVRRALRRIVLGKKANYYYRDDAKKKETTAA